MKCFIRGEHHTQSALFPESLGDYAAECNPVRVVGVCVERLGLGYWSLKVLNRPQVDLLIIHQHL